MNSSAHHVVSPFPPRHTTTSLDDTALTRAREGLADLSAASDAVVRDRLHLLSELSEDLMVLRAKGLTAVEISEHLERFSVDLPADTLRSFFDDIQMSRMEALERQIVHYRSTDTKHATQRAVVVEEGLRQALQQGEGLVLHYQPQVNSNTGEVFGAEALIRWRCQDTLVAPVEFIPVAEQSGLILEVGEWVLREACREAKRWQTIGLGGRHGIKMGVNLSVKQLTANLADLVHGVLCDTGLPTNLLGLEITESSIAGKDALNILHKLRSTGIHLSIDDFGTGYSCLSQLKDMPLDTVKIDQSFVKSLGRGEVPSLVVEAIINLAQKLKMGTIAEGVETYEHTQTLARMGCTMCQGYYYSAPMSAGAFVEYVIASTGPRHIAHHDPY